MALNNRGDLRRAVSHIEYESAPRQPKGSEVQTILAGAIQSVTHDHSDFESLSSSQWYHSQGGGSGSSSLSCLSLPVRSKIPLPVQKGLEPSVKGHKKLMREASSPCLLSSNTLKKKTPPPIPPKPRLLAKKVKPVLQRETSLPPNLETPSPRRGSFDWRPPRPNRERSFDSLASVPATPTQTLVGKGSSRIPIWRGSQESLNNKRWESCSNIEVYYKLMVAQGNSPQEHSSKAKWCTK
ncbi:hypothetical protein TCAL_17026 [Tigriopus californicus]|uniref:Uncharacterized protein n=1 Tax=Tigriopus californicus TaxID=6832 RepID=A0A553PFR4_TIGCA|nr:hypothetical protein TCAL_17026 [Tigriopus californicus]